MDDGTIYVRQTIEDDGRGTRTEVVIDLGKISVREGEDYNGFDSRSRYMLYLANELSVYLSDKLGIGCCDIPEK